MRESERARPLHFTSCNSDAQCVTHYSSIQCRDICVGKQKGKLDKTSSLTSQKDRVGGRKKGSKRLG